MSDQYQLRTAPPGWKGIKEDGSDTWGTLVGTYATLPETMTQAGHPELKDWHTATGIPDTLYLDWTLYYEDDRDYEDTEYLTPRFVIESPTVAAEFVGLLKAKYSISDLGAMLAAADAGEAECVYQIFGSLGYQHSDVKALTGVDRGQGWFYNAAVNTIVSGRF